MRTTSLMLTLLFGCQLACEAPREPAPPDRCEPRAWEDGRAKLGREGGLVDPSIPYDWNVQLKAEEAGCDLRDERVPPDDPCVSCLRAAVEAEGCSFEWFEAAWSAGVHGCPAEAVARIASRSDVRAAQIQDCPREICAGGGLGGG